MAAVRTCLPVDAGGLFTSIVQIVLVPVPVPVPVPVLVLVRER
ncbi:hypothetical protein SAMN05660350_00025 [Geodermatophilus obscurus]|uniref:Uncharacterized protein n=1 Tax=Geodermatophilus obscurus TaxID=1861 RepID=A0A1M7RRN9_9ACTN|nr:hypothetical protein [Geodermatophilus obscurus]SHN48909.1 hypothetical protein SAMN05660350_00025 [Geodermatophilus obscurus]